MGPLAEGHRHRRSWTSRCCASGCRSACRRAPFYETRRAAGSPRPLAVAAHRAAPLVPERRRHLSAAPAATARSSIRSPQITGAACRRVVRATALGPELPATSARTMRARWSSTASRCRSGVEILGAPVVELELAADRPLGASSRCACATCARRRVDARHLRRAQPHASRRPRDARAARARAGATASGCSSTTSAHAFPAGHRIRVAISTSYWPMVWPSPEPATLTVHTGASRSTCRCARRSRRDSGSRVACRPCCRKPLAITTLRAGGERRLITRDVSTGLSHVEVGDDQGLKRFDDIDLTMSSATQAHYTIHPDEPTSACAKVGWKVTMARGAWSIETRTRTIMTSTPAAFRLRATLDAYEGETRVVSKEWDSTIPRDHVSAPGTARLSRAATA